MMGFQLVDVGNAANDGNGDPLRDAFMKNNSNLTYMKELFARAKAYNGFDSNDTSTLGIIQYCEEASSGEVHRINEEGEYAKLTGQTYFADGITPLADRTVAQYKSSGETDFKYFMAGVKSEITTIKTLQLPDDSLAHYIAYNSSGDLYSPTNIKTAILEDVLVSLVVRNAVTGVVNYFADERHGFVMDGQTHLIRHLSPKEGFTWMGGLDISGLVNNGTTFSGISGGSSGDEDIRMAHAAITQCPIAYRLGSGGEMTLSPDTNLLGLFSGGDCVYNEWTGSEWVLSPIGSDYINMSFYATNNKIHPIIRVLAQTLHATRSIARDHLPSNVNDVIINDLISPEVHPLFTTIIHRESNGQIELGAEGEVYYDHRWGYPVARF